MSGLFRRLSSRRSDGPEGAEPPAQAEPGAADAPASDAPAEPGGHQSLLVDPAAQTRVLRDDDQPTTYQRTGDGGAAGEPAAASGQPHDARGGGPLAAESGTPHGAAAGTQDPAGTDPAQTLHPVVHPPVAEPPTPYGVAPPAGPMLPVSDLPAGVDPDELAAAPPTSARRSRLRRRVSFLRAAREVLLRDLGGFVYELHRTAGDIEHEAHRRLREVKLSRLTRLDAELHELELRLDDVRRHVVVREPGVGGECPHCGELFGSDAHYCFHCGLPLTESARKAMAAHEAAPPAAAAEPPAAPPHDQPTVEYSPLRAGDPEFAWPQRPASAGGQEPAATGGDAPTGVLASGETAAPGSEGASGAEPASGESATAADEAPTRVIGGGEAPAGSGEAAAGSEAAGADAGEAGGETPAAGTDPTGGDAPASDDSPVAAEPADRRDAVATGEGEGEVASGEPATSAEGEEPTAGGDERDDEAAGRNGSAFSPVERRR